MLVTKSTFGAAYNKLVSKLTSWLRLAFLLIILLSFKVINEQMITDEGSCQLYFGGFITSNNKKLLFFIIANKNCSLKGSVK